MATADRGQQRPPINPKEGWISDGRYVLHFNPLRHNRWSQSLESTTGEVMPAGGPPLAKGRKEITRVEAMRLWVEKRKSGWQMCLSQWIPPPSAANRMMPTGSQADLRRMVCRERGDGRQGLAITPSGLPGPLHHVRAKSK